jgi:predicted metal-dependent enzyme (double-stranded beta helix superfamily)
MIVDWPGALSAVDNPICWRLVTATRGNSNSTAYIYVLSSRDYPWGTPLLVEAAFGQF